MESHPYFTAIVEFPLAHRRMPTYREIMRLAGFQSTNAAYKLINKLIALDLIHNDSALPNIYFPTRRGNLPMRARR